MQKTCLVVIDGWGIDSNEVGNAVKAANTPCMTRLSNEFPFMSLSASGLDVGLPEGLMGNSEVGHLNIGAVCNMYIDRKGKSGLSGYCSNRISNQEINFMPARRRSKGV